MQCHGARVPDVTAPVPPRDDTPWVALAYDAFPHDKHLSVAATEDAPEGMRIKDCESCHEYADVPQPADPTRGIPEREFKRIKYERCQECHGSASAPDPVNWTTAWHGADDDGGTKCAQCHQDLHAPELTQVKRLSRATFSSGAHLYALTLRDHHDQFETGGKDCADCHRDGKISATSMKDRPFLHGVHLSKDPDKSQGQCRECHTDVVSGSLARSLTAGVYTHPLDDKNCFECHDTGIPQAGLRSGIPQLASTNQFPHASHLDTSKPGLENGCLSCHTLTSDLRSPDVPGTRPEARSCTECHQNHENVGGGDCRACHRTGDPVYRGESIMKSWPQPNAFSHRSRGHRDATCAECHTGTEGASSLREVPIPSEAETSCRDCHVKKRARFHWK
ncbi:MAG: hypothetical protein HRU14_14525 [Planctomycetes bacterium]|nr:hypothetical protein [Planctomycetota bacterium]